MDWVNILGDLAIIWICLSCLYEGIDAAKIYIKAMDMYQYATTAADALNRTSIDMNELEDYYDELVYLQDLVHTGAHSYAIKKTLEKIREYRRLVVISGYTTVYVPEDMVSIYSNYCNKCHTEIKVK